MYLLLKWYVSVEVFCCPFHWELHNALFSKIKDIDFVNVDDNDWG